jgi:hypothetical protein
MFKLDFFILNPKKKNIKKKSAKKYQKIKKLFKKIK